MFVRSQSSRVRARDAACSIKIRAKLQKKKTNQSRRCFGCGDSRLRCMEMRPQSICRPAHHQTAVNGGFISPTCGYKCELMQVAAIEPGEGFCVGGSLERNVLQFNATARVRREYQVICERGWGGGAAGGGTQEIAAQEIITRPRCGRRLRSPT